MTENKRFQVHKVIGSFHEWSIEDTIDDKIVFRSIIHKYEADRLCAKLNELHEENQKLIKVIEEDEKLIQSTYDELTKLRCIKKNLGRIKAQWGWIMEAIEYD